MTSRKNAMLTTEDRRWLTGEKSYEGEHAKQQRYQRRRDIRERVYNTVLDFSILVSQLEESERTKLFDRLEEDKPGDVTDEAFTEGLRDVLSFVLYNTGITESMLTEEGGRADSLAERLLEDAIYEAGKRDEILVEDVALSIESTSAPVSEVLADLEAGNEVSPAGLRLLMESDEIDTAAVQECVRRTIFEDEPETEER